MHNSSTTNFLHPMCTCHRGAENARLEDAELELSPTNCRGGKCGIGKFGNRKRMECHLWHRKRMECHLWHNLAFTAQCTIVQSAVLGSHVVCPSVCLWRWWIRSSEPHGLNILET